MFSFDPPRLLFGAPDPDGGFAGRVTIRPLMGDLGVRADRLGGEVNLVRRAGFDAPIFGRMIAKIAHSYAAAELDLAGFRPFLTDFILGKPTAHGAQWVGGEFAAEPKGTERNEISINLWSALYKDYYVVRLRLFADLEMPIYLIIAGEPINPKR
jgi:hypothetical protein